MTVAIALDALGAVDLSREPVRLVVIGLGVIIAMGDQERRKATRAREATTGPARAED